jgi:hypothetical protein
METLVDNEILSCVLNRRPPSRFFLPGAARSGAGMSPPAVWPGLSHDTTRAAPATSSRRSPVTTSCKPKDTDKEAQRQGRVVRGNSG